MTNHTETAAPSTPSEIASALAPHWNGEITNVEIAEDMFGWAVRVTVKPHDKRMRGVTWSDTGATRAEAIVEALDDHGTPWVYGLST